jgi:ArsR family transcriptional regulator, arsenate/arsenite/antimonite-responsive transcriptional repressor
VNDLVLLGKALADPTRVRILVALNKSDLCVCEMVDALEMSQSTLSSHLQTIRQAGLVQTTRRHKMVAYELEPSAATLLKPILQAYDDTLKVDHRLQRDAERIRERLQLRQDGLCCLGPGQLDKESA